MNWKQLQADQSVWAIKNFGVRPAWHPLLGIAEELGELAEALDAAVVDLGAVEDAVADTMIFMADFTNIMGFDLEHLCLEAEALRATTLRPTAISAVGKLCHSYLKYMQGIRGTPQQHLDAMRLSCTHVILTLLCVARGWSFDVGGATARTWAKVRLRNWKCQAEGCTNGLAYEGALYCGAGCAARSGA